MLAEYTLPNRCFNYGCILDTIAFILSTLRPQTKAADEGSATELECRFVAIPEAEVQWFHNKVELKGSDRVSIVHQADMHMYCR